MSHILIVDNHQATINQIDKNLGAFPSDHQVEILCGEPEAFTNSNTVVINVNQKNGYNRLFKAIREAHQKLKQGQRLIITGISNSCLTLQEFIRALTNGLSTYKGGFVCYDTVVCGIKVIGQHWMFERARA